MKAADVHDEASKPASGGQQSSLRFVAVTDADPRALVCVLQHLQTLNIVPKAVHACRLTDKFLEIKVETDALSQDTFRRMVAKIDQLPIVIMALPFNTDA